MLPTPCTCRRSYIFHKPGTLLTIQCEASLPAHQCRVGSSHSGCVSLGALLIPLPRRTITISLPLHLDHLLIGGGWGQSMMTFSPWTSGSIWLGGRQGTFGIKSSVRQCSTLEFASKEEDMRSIALGLLIGCTVWRALTMNYKFLLTVSQHACQQTHQWWFVSVLC